MGKSTISMAIFNSYVKLPEGTPFIHGWFCKWHISRAWKFDLLKKMGAFPRKWLDQRTYLKCTNQDGVAFFEMEM